LQYPNKLLLLLPNVILSLNFTTRSSSQNQKAVKFSLAEGDPVIPPVRSIPGRPPQPATSKREEERKV
jgi:hypothetical protein